MPIYEYTCQDCGARFEAMRMMKDADLPIHCKSCLGTNTRRAISRFNATSSGRSLTASNNGCGGCAGGSCATCHN